MNSLLERFNSRVSQIDRQSIPTEPVIQEQHFTEERWTVYLFTVPPMISKKVAFGFESKEVAKQFITDHLNKRPQGLTIGDTFVHVGYDVIFESREEINVFYNDPVLTTVGNVKEDVLERWLS